jgi:hypothetical protein
MKDQKTIYLLNEADLEMKINAALEDLDINEASILFNDIDMNEIELDRECMKEIKERTIKKLGLEATESIRYGDNTEVKHKVNAERRKDIRWKRYAAAAAIVLFILAVVNSDSIVLAFQNMISLIPGIGIVENNQEVKYRIKEPVATENDLCSLKILYGTATNDTITIRFDLVGMFTEEQRQKEKDKEDMFDVFLLVDNQKFQKYQGSSGSGISEYQYSYNCNYTFEVDQKYINTKKKYTLVCEDNNIRVNFRLSRIDQYSSPSEIGATEIHNDISLTASAFLKDGNLSVNVYPLNRSKYNLISFNQEYDLEYFKKKMTLNTDKGVKQYTPPSFYGTNLNASFVFDVSDGSNDYKLSIPFVVVEMEEEKEIKLPIPEEGETAEVNKEVAFENGSTIIKKVERLAGDVGNEYGYLKIYLEYTSLSENQQLVSVEFTGKDAVGWYPYNDDQNRVTAISYMLNESDTNELKLNVTNPRYVLMNPYMLDIKIQ